MVRSDNPLEKIDAEHLPEGGAWMSCQTFRIDLRRNPHTNKTFSEVFASGDGKLEGFDFYAQADTISFDQSKGMFELRSIAPRHVTIWRQEEIGSDRSENDARWVRIIPSKKEFKLERTTGIDGIP